MFKTFTAFGSDAPHGSSPPPPPPEVDMSWVNDLNNHTEIMAGEFNFAFVPEGMMRGI